MPDEIKVRPRVVYEVEAAVRIEEEAAVRWTDDGRVEIEFHDPEAVKRFVAAAMDGKVTVRTRKEAQHG